MDFTLETFTISPELQHLLTTAACTRCGGKRKLGKESRCTRCHGSGHEGVCLMPQPDGTRYGRRDCPSVGKEWHLHSIHLPNFNGDPIEARLYAETQLRVMGFQPCHICGGTGFSVAYAAELEKARIEASGSFFP